MFKFFLLIFVLIHFSFAIEIGEKADDFTLDQLGGSTFTLSEHLGKVVYIFWFGHGCPFCIQTNGPQSQSEIADMYSQSELKAVGIDTWSGSNASKVQSFKNSTGIQYPLLINGLALANQYQVTYDRSMIIDQEGIIRYYGGSHSPHNWDEIRSVIDGLLTATNLEDGAQTPLTFGIKSNFPNPFNPSTTILFSVDKAQKIKLQIFNITGQLITTLLDEAVAAGNYESLWNGRDAFNKEAGSGIYFARLSGESESEVQRLILLK